MNSVATTETAAKKSSKRIVVLDIRENDRKYAGRTVAGKVAKGLHAIVEPGKRVTLLGDMPESYIESCHVHEDCRANHAVATACARHAMGAKASYRKVFELGDDAVYGSFNLVYTGRIVAIGEKTVSIEDMGRTHRLDLATFNRRNWNYDAERIRKHNNEWMD